MAAKPHRAVSPLWLAALALVAAVASGLLFFWIGGAPAAYIPVNAASLALALAAMFAMPAACLRGRGATWVVAICLAGIGLTLVSGFNLDGVRRWLPLGPVRLHGAMFLLPAMLAALPRLPDRWQLAVVATTAAIVLLQPDPASALALGLGFALSQRRRWREPTIALGLAVNLFAVVAAALSVAPLAPLPFVENVLADGWFLHPGLGLLMSAALALAILAPARWSNVGGDSALGASGAWVGYTAASLIGAYPTPLVGYGAAAILGYGLALAVLRGLPQRG